MKHWLQVDLSVPSEFVEPISNFLMEQGADGIEEVDEGRKWRKVKAYFPQRVREKKVLPAIRRYLTSVQRIFPKAFHISSIGEPFLKRTGVRVGDDFSNLFK